MTVFHTTRHGDPHPARRNSCMRSRARAVMNTERRGERADRPNLANRPHEALARGFWQIHRRCGRRGPQFPEQFSREHQRNRSRPRTQDCREGRWTLYDANESATIQRRIIRRAKQGSVGHSVLEKESGPGVLHVRYSFDAEHRSPTSWCHAMR